MKTENIVLGGVVAACAAVLIFRKKDDTGTTENFTEDLPVTTPVINTPAPVVLNKSLVLKKGSKGNEVRELQKLLKVTADGDFGANTEGALFTKKGVKQISLNQYSSAPDVNTSALPIKTRVMANVKAGVKVNEVGTKADGTMYDTGKVYDTIAYGEEIGTIISISTSKNYYVVALEKWFGITVNVWVKASEVAKI